MVAALGLAAFLQQVAMIEAREIQGAIIAALARACGVFLVTIFVITSLVREFNDKVIELMLAQSFPRLGYPIGKFFGFAAVALITGLGLSLPLTLWVPLGALGDRKRRQRLRLLLHDGSGSGGSRLLHGRRRRRRCRFGGLLLLAGRKRQECHTA